MWPCSSVHVEMVDHCSKLLVGETEDPLTQFVVSVAVHNSDCCWNGDGDMN